MTTIATQSSGNKFYVTFWGTRGSISTPGSSTEKYGGNTSCISVRYKNTELILDAGTGIRNLGLQIAEQIKKSSEKTELHLLLSHTHWDHIQGIPFFAPAYLKETKLAVYGSPKKESFLAAILQHQMDVNYFPIEMNQLAAEISVIEISSEQLQIGPITVDWQEQFAHPGGSVRFRLSAGDKRIAYATDVELDKIFGNGKKNGENGNLEREYCKFIAGVDLLIADGQYTSEEYPLRVGFGHTSIPMAIDIAHKQNVKQLAVFHHDPQHSDTMLDKLWKSYAPQYAVQSSPMNLFWAREGMTIAI